MEIDILEAKTDQTKILDESLDQVTENEEVLTYSMG